MLWWKVCGGAIYETRGDSSEAFALLQFGGGLWLKIGEERGLFTGLTLQLAMGDGMNAPVVLLLNGGLDF